MRSLGVAIGARARREAAGAAEYGLAFDRPGGPLVGVCGVAGGAGTSTLALALARQAARESRAPVLVCEADSRAGGMAALARIGSTHSLGELAAAALAGAPPRGAPYAELPGGLRMIAAALGAELGDSEQMRQVLAEARTAHGLVIADGGVLGGPGAEAALAGASHALLVMPATAIGITRAERFLGSPLAPRHSATLVAVARSTPAVRPRELRSLAERYVDHLVFVPHVAALERGEPPGSHLDVVLASLATVLRRSH